MSDFNQMAGAAFLVFLGIWLFGRPSQGEDVTIHYAFCPAGRVSGACSTGGETANPTTYRAYIDQQTVIKWTWNSGTITRFTFCAVRDGRNWTCKFEKAEDAPTVEYTMSDGELSTTDFRSAKDRPLGGATPEPFYEVPRWYWWFVWTSEHLRRRPL
jgi:hypothetical protein